MKLCSMVVYSVVLDLWIHPLPAQGDKGLGPNHTELLVQRVPLFKSLRPVPFQWKYLGGLAVLTHTSNRSIDAIKVQEPMKI